MNKCISNHTEECTLHNCEKHSNTLWCQDVRKCEDLNHPVDLETK